MSFSTHSDSAILHRVGVDSDGTVFDSMEVKHKRVFQPLAIEIWGLESVAADFHAIAERVNLYSAHRGVNRFEGLAMAFERLAERSAEGRGILGDFGALREFVDSGLPLSAKALGEFNRTRSSPCIDRVLEWSRRSDERYAEITAREGNVPFDAARSSIESLSSKAVIMVVSSSARGALLQDWGEAGLLPLVAEVLGQERGDKITQIRHLLLNREPGVPERCLMIGDAMGDWEAARATGIFFYPILPGAEEESWRRFAEEAMGRFLRGTYGGSFQQSLLEEFEAGLRPEAASAQFSV